jgi:hypothetical protein
VKCLSPIEPGERFERLVVLYHRTDYGPGRYYTCRCDCGKRRIVRGADLRMGNTRSCGCLHKEKGIPIATGTRFSRLVVLLQVDRPQQGRWFLCLCDCGNKHVTRGADLRAGGVRSCGCLMAEHIQRLRELRKTSREDLGSTREGAA